MPTILSISNLSKTYASGLHALKDVNLGIVLEADQRHPAKRAVEHEAHRPVGRCVAHGAAGVGVKSLDRRLVRLLLRGRQAGHATSQHRGQRGRPARVLIRRLRHRIERRPPDLGAFLSMVRRSVRSVAKMTQ